MSVFPRDLDPKSAELLRAERQAHDETREQLARAMHALEQVGFPTHEDLDACGCELCEATRASMLSAGFLESRYREGYEYVVCEACGSHIEIAESRVTFGLGDGERGTTRFESFTCDNDDCEADFMAEVHCVPRPRALEQG